MGRVDWTPRIVVDPAIHHGDPCIKGTRIPVAVIVGSVADGMTVEEVCATYPQLVPDDVRAALAYSAEVLRREIVLPLAG